MPAIGVEYSNTLVSIFNPFYNRGYYITPVFHSCIRSTRILSIFRLAMGAVKSVSNIIITLLSTFIIFIIVVHYFVQYYRWRDRRLFFSVH